MKFRSAVSAAVIALAYLMHIVASSPATMDGTDFTDNDIKDYFGGITSGSRKGVMNYDIVDLWDQPNDSPARLPLRLAGPHRQQQDVHFTAFRETFHLRLRQNSWLAREGLRMDTLSPNGTVVSSKEVERNCYYFGEVLSHNSSSVALSKCDGLAGVITYGEHDIFIKPLRSEHAERYRRRRRDAVDPHIVYRRSAGDSDPAAQFCSLPPPLRDIETGLTVEEEMAAALDVKLLPSSLQLGQKYMELMVMVDNDMRTHYGDDLESYVMSILNIVARRFVDSSLGANLRIHLVELYVLNDDQVGTGSDGFSTDNTFTVSNNADKLLKNFCQWQGAKNEDDDINPEHWDNAIFITRKDLIDPTNLEFPLALAGLAKLGGTCKRYRQCSVIEDSGVIGTAQTITHEVAHTLNVKHDIDLGCPDLVNLMSRTLMGGVGGMSWSTCSQTKLQEFLRNPLSNCLNDEPLYDPISVKKLPGTVYSYAEQCRQGLDGDRLYTIPFNRQVNCSLLVCQSGNTIYTRSILLLEGTECGIDKWCISGQCVQRIPLPDAVDGQWSAWGGDAGSAEFGPCTRSCGGGVRSRMRYCNNPPPSNGGRGCDGSNAEYIVCEMQACATSQDDFRDEQCVATNSVPLYGVLYNWFKAYTTQQTGNELCQYKCLNDQQIYSKREPFRFSDGTRCWHNEKNDLGKLKLCVNGLCKSFGCDGRENSHAEFDVCGVCNGDGSSCLRVSDSFSGESTAGFVRFLTLPVGSMSVEITNTNYNYIYIALKIGSEYVLGDRGTGNSRPPASGRYSAGGSVVLYKRRQGLEGLTIAGPTTQEISVEASLVNNRPVNYEGVRPEVQYQYYTPIESGSAVPESFRWVSSVFSSCTATCGGGTQTRSVTCRHSVNAREEAVRDAFCPQPKPSDMQACNTEMCPMTMPARWETSDWFPCSVTCGEGTRRRMVRCVRDGVETPGDAGCDQGDKPAEEEACLPGDCSPIVPSVSRCRGVTAEPSGIIYTIGRNTAGKTCSQVIAAPPGTAVVLTIVKLAIDCDTESFVVSFAGLSETYCGDQTNIQLTFQHNIVVIEHRTSAANSGYHISYTLADSVTPPNPCDKVLTVASGRITSPNWPSPYGPNQMCTTTIVVKPGKRIQLKFKKFVLDGERPSCSKDSVSITDNYARTVVYCGTKRRFNFRSKSNIIAVTFRSDASTELKGFNAVLSQID